MGRPDKIRAALFDFDGTLADTERFGIELDEAAFSYFGISPTEEEKSSLAGTDGSESIPELFSHYGMKVSAPEFFARRPDHAVIYREKPLTVTPGARELIERLAGQGASIAVVSTTRHELVETALKRLELAPLVDLLVGGDDVERHKPDPEPFRHALECFGLPAGEAIAFEDSPTGVRSAMRAGVYTFGFSGSCVPQDVSAADETFASFERLSL